MLPTEANVLLEDWLQAAVPWWVNEMQPQAYHRGSRMPLDKVIYLHKNKSPDYLGKRLQLYHPNSGLVPEFAHLFHKKFPASHP